MIWLIVLIHLVCILVYSSVRCSSIFTQQSGDNIQIGFHFSLRWPDGMKYVGNVHKNVCHILYQVSGQQTTVSCWDKEQKIVFWYFINWLFSSPALSITRIVMLCLILFTFYNLSLATVIHYHLFSLFFFLCTWQHTVWRAQSSFTSAN